MIRTLLLASCAVILTTAALAGHGVAVLDGTSWQVDVKPDQMAQDKGERQFKETLTFADGKISLNSPKVGFAASPYTVSKSGEKNLTFKAERSSAGEGSSIWTGVVHDNNIEGKLIFTMNDGAVLTYTFKGRKLD